MQTLLTIVLGSGLLGFWQERSATDAMEKLLAIVQFKALEQEIFPKFYTRDAQGIPRAWVARMRASMA